MAERWQQWMPFHIDRWKGSAHVQAMSPAARAGYIYLLSAAWQTPNCSLPTDSYTLSVLAGYSASEWDDFGPAVLRRFELCDGFYINAVLMQEWLGAKRIFESRQNAAKTTNKTKAVHGDRTVTERRPSRSADTITGTLTNTSTKELNTLALTCEQVPAASPAFITFPLIGKKTHIVTEADVSLWQEAYPAIDIRAELRKVIPWLDANPEKRSATVNGSKKRVVKWLTRAQDNPRSNGGSNGIHRKSENDGDRQEREALEYLARKEAENNGHAARSEDSRRVSRAGSFGLERIQPINH